MPELITTDPRLTPAKPMELTKFLKLLTSSFAPSDSSDPEVVLQGYAVALVDLPAWAIAGAVGRFLQGKVEGQSLKFCPRPAELAKAVRAEIQPVVEELQRREREHRMAEERRQFAGRRRSQDERERIAERYRAWQQTFGDQAERIDLDAIRAKYDPALLAAVPDREQGALQGFSQPGGGQ